MPRVRKDSPPAIPRQWAWHYRTLQRIRELLIRERDEHTAAARTPLEREGADAVDIANDKTEQATLLAEIRFEDAELAEVEAALGRIRNNTYGICELTHCPISAPRLRAIPWTRLSHQAAIQLAQRLQR